MTQYFTEKWTLSKLFFNDFALINRKYILICKLIDWFLRKQPARSVSLSEIFLSLKLWLAVGDGGEIMLRSWWSWVVVAK